LSRQSAGARKTAATRSRDATNRQERPYGGGADPMTVSMPSRFHALPDRDRPPFTCPSRHRYSVCACRLLPTLMTYERPVR
jgi:hypothetical protein